MQRQRVSVNDQPRETAREQVPEGTPAALRASRLALRACRRALRSSRWAMQATHSRRAFTLIEMIGVLAVLALLASALIPVAIRRIDRAAWTKEVGELGSISNALTLQIARNYAIPNQANWAAVAAGWNMRPVSQISTNSRGFARLFFYDSGGWMTNAPYTQTSSGTGPLSGARIAIVSTIAKAFPNVNGPLSTANFNSVWNAAQGATPSYLTSLGWTGKGDDLVIQRLNLDRLFHRLLLETRDASSSARFSINSTAPAATLAVPNNASGWSSYYLDSSVVGLWSGSILTNRFVLNGDISFVFDGGMWQAQLTGAGEDNSTVATNFGYQAASFIATDNVPNGHQGGTAQSVLSAFYSFMYSYTIWANECPHFQANATSLGQQTDYLILDALGGNGKIIDSASGYQNGLLK
jgi:prepilin-type N-terminal cleavage/methylation domain-containing protein